MWAGAGWVSPSASPLENVLVCLEARLILPLNLGRKWILDSGLKVGPSEGEDQMLWCFQQANAAACLEAGAGGTYKQHSAIYWSCPPESKSSSPQQRPIYRSLNGALQAARVCNLLLAARAQTQTFSVPS